jgi:outer membrane protein assembly factor BamD
MMQRSNRNSICPPSRSSISDFRTALTTGFAAAALLAATLGAHAQDTAPAPDAAAPAASATQTAAPDAGQAATPAAQPQNDINLTNQKEQKTRKAKEDKVVESKDTKKEDKKVKKDITLAGMDTKLPDKQLYDKAEDAIKHGRFDVGRLDLQTLLNTYSESQYMMRAKLAIADSWYKEGGTAALAQAEQEYKDFITFFPNAPEAAEAQMRVGDIYFRQMDKPDRDYTTTLKAEQEYRLMLQQFPDSTLVPQAQQRLREVQEVLANREANIAAFYAQRQPPNYAGAIARYQTVVDSYPLYSHMDDVLIGLGDAFEAEAKFFRAMRLPPAANKAQENTFEAGKARLEKIYDDQAQAAYDKVVLEHAAAAHVEDAKDRLVGMGLPVPTPTPQQLAASTALENSRGQYTLSKRAVGFFMHQADTVPAATAGAPPLEDPTPTSAAAIALKGRTDYITSMTLGNQAPAVATAKPASAPAGVADPAATTAPAAPLQFQDVPTDTGNVGTSSTVTNVPVSSPSSPPGGSMGIEIVQPGSGSQAPVTAPATPPAFPGTAPANAATATPQAQPAADNGGIGPVGPPNATPLAPIEKPAAAPDAINDAANTKQPVAQPPANGKKPKVACDKSDESCSKHKPKKGLAKLNPF